MRSRYTFPQSRINIHVDTHSFPELLNFGTISHLAIVIVLTSDHSEQGSSKLFKKTDKKLIILIFINFNLIKHFHYPLYNHHLWCLPLVLLHSHVDFTAQKPEDNKILKTCEQKLFLILFLFFETVIFARCALHVILTRGVWSTWQIQKSKTHSEFADDNTVVGYESHDSAPLPRRKMPRQKYIFPFLEH